MTTHIQRVSLSRQKDDCFFLDGGFQVDLESPRELAGGSFRLLGPGEERITSAQRSAFGELYRERIQIPDTCQDPIFRGFRIQVDHEACVVQVTMRIALRRPDHWLHVPRDRDLPLLCPLDGPDAAACDAEIERVWQDMVDERKPHWKRVIEDKWSEKFRLVPTRLAEGLLLNPFDDDRWAVWLRTVGGGTISNCNSYLIRVTVDWIDPTILTGRGVNAEDVTTWDTRVDYIVTVQFGGGGTTRDEAFQWHLGMFDNSLAHEFGHLFGNADEYDGTCDGCPDRPIVEGSIMNSLVIWPNGVMAHHYFLVSFWMWSRTCTPYRVVSTEAGLSAGGDIGVPIRDVVQWYFKYIDCP